MLFEWIWKNRRSVDKQMLDIMDRMAVATERSATAAEASHAAAVKSAESAVRANEASQRRNEIEIEFVTEEMARRRLQDERYAKD